MCVGGVCVDRQGKARATAAAGATAAAAAAGNPVGTANHCVCRCLGGGGTGQGGDRMRKVPAGVAPQGICAVVCTTRHRPPQRAHPDTLTLLMSPLSDLRSASQLSFCAAALFLSSISAIMRARRKGGMYAPPARPWGGEEGGGQRAAAAAAAGRQVRQSTGVLSESKCGMA